MSMPNSNSMLIDCKNAIISLNKQNQRIFPLYFIQVTKTRSQTRSKNTEQISTQHILCMDAPEVLNIICTNFRVQGFNLSLHFLLLHNAVS